MTNAIHVAHLSGEQWVVTTDDDSAPPISTHDTRAAAETAARSHAMTFGIPKVLVHGQGGAEELQLLGDVDPQPTAEGGPPYGPPV